MSADKRLAFLAAVLRQEGKPYLWDSNGPLAFDCSGLVVYGMRDPDVFGPEYADRSCREFWTQGKKVLNPKPGDLALYKTDGKPTHVMVCADGGLKGRVFGACGGDSKTTTLEIALKRGAAVRYQAKPNYRDGLMGFVDPFGEP